MLKSKFEHSLTCKKCQRKYPADDVCRNRNCKYKLNCVVCNIDFWSNNGDSKLCTSKKCKLTLNCIVCQTQFETRNLGEKLCSTCTYTLTCQICKNQFQSRGRHHKICSSDKCTFTLKCVICKKKFQSKREYDELCNSNSCYANYELLEIQNECSDPVVGGRLRDGSLENMRMGTAWGIRKKHIPKRELISLRKKYEPNRYGVIESNTPKSKSRRRPKDGT